MNQDQTTVIVIDDEDLFRDLLCRQLSGQPEIRVIGDFASAAPALASISDLRPDVAVLDISLGSGINGVQLGLKLRTALPHLGIVLLSNVVDPSLLLTVPKAALAGWLYLHKSSIRQIRTLVQAIVQTRQPVK
ncbi:MAG TPA: response regulator transcription factor [Symbiobacteriaceae bacterium]|nr:response regulator transcription factor [Symbiobacteriaceae bacterium]